MQTQINAINFAIWEGRVMVLNSCSDPNLSKLSTEYVMLGGFKDMLLTKTETGEIKTAGRK